MARCFCRYSECAALHGAALVDPDDLEEMSGWSGYKLRVSCMMKSGMWLSGGRKVGFASLV